MLLSIANVLVCIYHASCKLVCLNCSPFYRRKSSENANVSTGTLLPPAEVSEQFSHTNVDVLTRTQVDKHREWSSVNERLPSTVTVDSVPEVMPAVDGSVTVRPSLLSSSQRTVDSNSLVSSAAATSVLNNGLFLPCFIVYYCMNNYSIVHYSFKACRHSYVGIAISALQ